MIPFTKQQSFSGLLSLDDHTRSATNTLEFKPFTDPFSFFLSFFLCDSKWSYGVLLWELMTLGQQPYGNIDAFEMLNFLKQGHRISQPVNCPDELFTVIACCWALSEDERPGFGQLIVCLTDFLNALSNFI